MVGSSYCGRCGCCGFDHATTLQHLHYNHIAFHPQPRTFYYHHHVTPRHAATPRHTTTPRQTTTPHHHATPPCHTTTPHPHTAPPHHITIASCSGDFKQSEAVCGSVSQVFKGCQPQGEEEDGGDNDDEEE